MNICMFIYDHIWPHIENILAMRSYAWKNTHSKSDARLCTFCALYDIHFVRLVRSSFQTGASFYESLPAKNLCAAMRRSFHRPHMTMYVHDHRWPHRWNGPRIAAHRFLQVNFDRGKLTCGKMSWSIWNSNCHLIWSSNCRLIWSEL